MRGMLFGLAAMGVGGTAYWAGSPGPDFDRYINRPQMNVYAAFSALAQEGETTEPATDGMPSMTRRVVKVRGETIQVEFLFDDRPVFDVELNFEPGPDGRGTRMTAELDIDAYELGSAFETEAGVALSLVPDSYIDTQFANFMDDMAEDIEAGRPLAPLGLDDAGVRRNRASPASAEARRAQAAEGQREAARPMMRPEPMTDPNEAARDHVRNGGASDARRY